MKCRTEQLCCDFLSTYFCLVWTFIFVNVGECIFYENAFTKPFIFLSNTFRLSFVFLICVYNWQKSKFRALNSVSVSSFFHFSLENSVICFHSWPKSEFQPLNSVFFELLFYVNVGECIFDGNVMYPFTQPFIFLSTTFRLSFVFLLNRTVRKYSSSHMVLSSSFPFSTEGLSSSFL